MVSGRPKPDHADFGRLLFALDAEVVALTECRVASGWTLAFDKAPFAGLHYCTSGAARLIVGDDAPIALAPHMLIMTPPNRPYRFEVPDAKGALSPTRRQEARFRTDLPAGAIQRIVAGEEDPRLVLICGLFRVRYGASLDPFASMTAPITAAFEDTMRPAGSLHALLAEVREGQLGARAMARALLTEVLIALFRRQATVKAARLEPLSILHAPPIARALAEMTSRPDAPHSMDSLSRAAGLSRSAFALRFRSATGRTPMAALRDIRMGRAADLLARGNLTEEQVAGMVGYRSRSSFLRAFRAVHGATPSGYLAEAGGSPDTDAPSPVR
jgi:AraC family transcriptional activator of mtrCDE